GAARRGSFSPSRPGNAPRRSSLAASRSRSNDRAARRATGARTGLSAGSSPSRRRDACRDNYTEGGSMFTRESARPARRPLLFAPVLGLLSLLVLDAGGPAAANSRAGGSARPTIVLEHGDWADASSWTRVMKRLQDDGFTVVAPPNLLRGPATDAPYLASFLKSISGPIVLVAHSYGGVVPPEPAPGPAT